MKGEIDRLSNVVNSSFGDTQFANCKINSTSVNLIKGIKNKAEFCYITAKY